MSDSPFLTWSILQVRLSPEVFICLIEIFVSSIISLWVFFSTLNSISFISLPLNCVTKAMLILLNSCLEVLPSHFQQCPLTVEFIFHLFIFLKRYVILGFWVFISVLGFVHLELVCWVFLYLLFNSPFNRGVYMFRKELVHSTVGMWFPVWYLGLHPLSEVFCLSATAWCLQWLGQGIWSKFPLVM